MKKIYNLILILFGLTLITGCGKVDESLSGVYKNDSDFSIMIYSKDNKIASFAVLQEGPNYKLYPATFENAFSVSDNNLSMINGEPVKISKNGFKINITFDGEEKGVWENILGEYTKVKNIKKFNFNQF